MKKLLIALSLVIFGVTANAQILKGKESTINFFSSTPLEDISANNKFVVVVLKPSTNALQIEVQNRGFIFEKALMQEHFHETYMETDKVVKVGDKDTYPNKTAKFVGKIVEAVDYTKDGETAVTAKGKLTMHGVTKEVEIKGKVKVTKGVVTLDAKFPVKLADYEIKVPSVVTKNIAEVIDVTINSTLENFTPEKK